MNKNLIPYLSEKTLALLCGLFFICSIISISTFHPLDPSFNHITDNEVYNKGGIIGAYFSSFILESFGLSFLTILSFSLYLSICFFKSKNIELLSLKIISICICLISTSFILASIPTANFWPFLSYGGVLGYFVKYKTTLLFYPYFWIFLAIFLTLFTFCYAHNISFKHTIKFMWHLIYILCKKIKYILKKLPRIIKLLSNKTYLIYEKKYSKKRNKDADSVLLKKTKSSRTMEYEAIPKIKHNDKYTLPSLSILKPTPVAKKMNIDKGLLEKNTYLLQQVLEDFSVNGKITNVKAGPVVTLYELEPSPGIKSSRIIGLADDVARSMSAVSARIAVISGQNALGIELPNENRETVYFRELLESAEYRKKDIKIPLALGKNIGGEPIMADLAKMPHLLVAGTTGSGKSVAINTMILSILYRMSPDECKFIMVDPKMLELSVYDGIPHLLSPVVTDPKKAVQSLRWAVSEMENRYKLMSAVGVRNVAGYNEAILKAKKENKALTRQVQTGFDAESGKAIFEEVAIDMETMPYIVIIIDEMADLMLVAGKEIESYIQRLAQMARAAGLHLIIATQRPSVDVITGVIKANFPTRISFQVTSKIDSRTILGEQGAEQLLGQGDMLFMYGGTKVTRIHGPFASDEEVGNIVTFLKKQAKPSYVENIFNATTDSSESNFPEMANDDDVDELYDKAAEIVIKDKKVSTSYIQRQLKIGYNRAANIVEKMESEGLISAPNATGRREVLEN